MAIVMVDAKAIEALVGLNFTSSGDFNGLPLSAVFKIYTDEAAVRAAVIECIGKDRVSCAFYSVSGNPHIKRIRDLPVERQIELFSTEPSQGVCLYPCAELVREFADVDEYNDRPFTKKMLLGAAQLDWEGFDLGVLERYQNDPRYLFHFYDHSGMLSIGDSASSNAAVLERDQVFLQSFGVGYGEDDSRLAVVFLRYLSGLSPEHQQYWNSFRYPGKVKLHKEYYRSSYLGEWPEYISYIGAILTEMRLINQLTSAVYGQPLFREAYTDEQRPPGFTPFFRPTLKNFNDFVLAMDKLLSENLNHDFFRGRVLLEMERVREDGKIVVERRSSVAMLDAWLRNVVRWKDEDDAIAMIVGPLRRVRRQRQAPAHKLQENEYSTEYDEQQHTIFREVYLGLMNLRMMFARHPKAPPIDVPDYLAEGKIAFA
jgi:hypothetical protein